MSQYDQIVTLDIPTATLVKYQGMVVTFQTEEEALKAYPNSKPLHLTLKQMKKLPDKINF